MAEQPLNYINEVILKKRKDNEFWAVQRKHNRELKAKSLKSRRPDVIMPEQFIQHYRDKEMDLIKMKQRAKKRSRRALVASDSSLLFVIRIGGQSSSMHPRTQKLLHSLRLRKIFSGVFVKADRRVLDILQKVEPYVTYGYPNLKTIRDLVYKKGAGKTDMGRVPLTSNDVIEQALGQYGILCVEDIVNEVAKVGPHFRDVTRFLCPFVLNKPEKELKNKKKLFVDGGASGNRESHINDLVSLMN